MTDLVLNDATCMSCGHPPDECICDLLSIDNKTPGQLLRMMEAAGIDMGEYDSLDEALKALQDKLDEMAQGIIEEDLIDGSTGRKQPHRTAARVPSGRSSMSQPGFPEKSGSSSGTRDEDRMTGNRSGNEHLPLPHLEFGTEGPVINWGFAGESTDHEADEYDELPEPVYVDNTRPGEHLPPPAYLPFPSGNPGGRVTNRDERRDQVAEHLPPSPLLFG